MKQEDRAAFANLLGQAMAVWGKDVSPFLLNAWWSVCERYELEQISKALTAHLTDPDTGRFAPLPSAIVKALHGTQTDRALMAWAVVSRAICDYGAYRSIVFDEPAIHAAISDLGGWQVLCGGQVDEMPFAQKRFCDAYRMYSTRGCSAWPPVLIGAHQQQNGLLGRAIRSPQLIGDAQGCSAVMAGPVDQLARLSGVAQKRIPIEATA